jgi:hypothetical protein
MSNVVHCYVRAIGVLPQEFPSARPYPRSVLDSLVAYGTLVDACAGKRIVRFLRLMVDKVSAEL